jgi:hypothetical protein
MSHTARDHIGTESVNRAFAVDGTGTTGYPATTPRWSSEA